MKSINYVLVLGVFLSAPCFAQVNYASNILSPIPPACATNHQIWEVFNTSGSQILVQGTIQASSTLAVAHDLDVTAWRKGCPNSNRSVIMLDLTVPDNFDGVTDCLFIPLINARLPSGEEKKMRLLSEPNTHFGTDELNIICEGNFFRFFVDAVSSYSQLFDLALVISALEYNGSWTMEIVDFVTGTWTAEIPAYLGDLGSSRMALTGRLSGTWVVSGIPDQGFLLAFEELTDVFQSLLFFTFYTYDKDGNLLWLSGVSFYALGDTQVQFNIELVTNGQFMGTKTADRAVVGSGTIVANNCNDLTFNYDLSQLGLGSNSVTLVRVLSLETQGYACSDLLTRLIHENDA